MMRDNIEKKSDEENYDIDGTSVDQIGSPESNPQKRLAAELSSPNTPTEADLKKLKQTSQPKN